MSIRRKMRSTIKWGGAAVTVLLLIVWVGSGWYATWFLLKPVLQVSVWSGQIMLVIPNDWSTVPQIADGGISKRMSWRHDWRFDIYRLPQASAIAIPMWFVFISVAAPTLVICYRDYRLNLVGKCPKCGYSRTGLPADRACPECGSAAA